MQDHGKICVDYGNKKFYRYVDQNYYLDKLYVEFNGIGKFTLDPIVKFTNKYLFNCFK